MKPLEVLTNPVRPWSRSTSVLLFFVGLVLCLASFAVVVAMGTVPWHGARDAELTATYDTYRDTGVLLIKPTGSGSYGAQAPAPGPLSAATWDDDPGAYIVASLMSHITGSSSPYPGLALAQGLLVALPLLWLPYTVARLFKSARAGYALILLPPLLWVINHGAVLVGTEYGLADAASPTRVYAVYGIAASMAFLSLSLLLLLSTIRLKWSVLVALTLGVAVLAGFGNLSRAYSGMGIALCVGVLWWLNSSKRWRLVAGVLGSVVAIALAVLVQTGVMGLINTARVEATGQTLQQLPDAHALWHSMYMGLSYPQPITGVPSKFDVKWSDEFGWEKAREVDPSVVVASAHYDAILKDLYWEKVSSDPWGAVKLYAQKALYVAGHFGGMLAFIIAGFGLALWRKGPHRKPLVLGLVIGIPTLVLGLAPPVLVMPLLYYYSEISASLGLLVAISLGAFVWSLSSLPAQILRAERGRLKGRNDPHAPVAGTEARAKLSVIVAVGHDQKLPDMENIALRDVLSPNDEFIVVGHGGGGRGGSDGFMPPLSEDDRDIACRWIGIDSSSELGDALRTGALASTGQRLLLIGHASYANDSDVWGMTQSDPHSFTVGSAIDPDSAPHSLRRRLVSFFRSAILPLDTPESPEVVCADGTWIRSFAKSSRESGEMWMTELVVAAIHQGIGVRVVPLQVHNDGDGDQSGKHPSTFWQTIRRFTSVSFHKDEYTPDAAVQKVGS